MDHQKGMRILCAFDKFKDSIDGESVGRCVLESVKNCLGPSGVSVEGEIVEMADGGDGFLNALKNPLKLQIEEVDKVEGPLGTPIRSRFGISQDSSLAVIEMADVSGLHLVAEKDRNPLNTTTHGVGVLIKKALSLGAKKIIVGVGGSATNDGGLGALVALGLKAHLFVEGKDKKETHTPEMIFGRDLGFISHLELPEEGYLLPPGVEVVVAVDVGNPFVGENGATFIFGPQKGADVDAQETLEKGMHLLASHYSSSFSSSFSSSLSGTGAAGGLSGGLIAAGCKTMRGVDIVSSLLELEEKVERSDVVFSGEGSYDSQTAEGKTVSEVQRLCKKHNKPLVLICGRSDVVEEETKNQRVFTLVSLFEKEKCMKEPKTCLETLVTQAFSDFPGFHNKH